MVKYRIADFQIPPLNTFSPYSFSFPTILKQAFPQFHVFVEPRWNILHKEVIVVLVSESFSGKSTELCVIADG